MPLPPALPEGTTMLPKGTFDGRVVAITGGGTGLGKAFGLEFARLGGCQGGVHNLTYSLAVEWAPYGIRVSALVPGYFPHEDLPREVLEANVGSSAGMNTPAQRLGRPHELAWAATYLCSPFAAMVTGRSS